MTNDEILAHLDEIENALMLEFDKHAFDPNSILDCIQKLRYNLQNEIYQSDIDATE